MKTNILKTLCFSLCVLLVPVTSCKKDDDKPMPVQEQETVKDIDGNVYKTVKIGNQVWMAENLKTTRYRDGSEIPTGLVFPQWRDITTGAYAVYDNNPANNDTYGKLYNWYAVNTAKLAPLGWHVPTDAEWHQLINYLGGDSVAGDKMKATTLWKSPDYGATNSSGFSALPGGNRVSTGQYHDLGEIGKFWSSTEYNLYSARSLNLYYGGSEVLWGGGDKHDGRSVRCVRD